MRMNSVAIAFGRVKSELDGYLAKIRIPGLLPSYWGVAMRLTKTAIFLAGSLACAGPGVAHAADITIVDAFFSAQESVDAAAIDNANQNNLGQDNQAQFGDHINFSETMSFVLGQASASASVQVKDSFDFSSPSQISVSMFSNATTDIIPAANIYTAADANILANTGEIDMNVNQYSVINGIGYTPGFYAFLFTDNTSSVLSFNALPEPATWAFMLVGFGAVGTMLRRRRMPQPLGLAPA